MKATQPKKVGTSAGKSRAQIKQESLMRRQSILAYIERQAPAATDTIIAALGYQRSVTFSWLRGMLASGHVEMEQIGVTHRTNIWKRGPNMEPIAEFKRECADFMRKDPVIKRKIVKAKQLGMAPYADLPADFFHPVAA